MIKDLSVSDEGRLVTWEAGNTVIQKKYDHSATAESLCDDDLIIIVEPDEDNFPNNAVVYSAKGDFVRRISNPFLEQDAICFDSVYSYDNKVILVSACPRAFHELRLNKKDGSLLGTSETR